MQFHLTIYIPNDRTHNTMAIYPDFIATKGYSQELQDCVENTVNFLLDRQTKVSNPGMQLGKIQSGKTRTFIRIAALTFDRGYDICIVFTKGTKAVAEQNRTDLAYARNIAQETPCFILLKQMDNSTNGWRDVEFWWHIVVTPANTRTAVLASETLN